MALTELDASLVPLVPLWRTKLEDFYSQQKSKAIREQLAIVKNNTRYWNIVGFIDSSYDKNIIDRCICEYIDEEQDLNNCLNIVQEYRKDIVDTSTIMKALNTKFGGKVVHIADTDDYQVRSYAVCNRCHRVIESTKPSTQHILLPDRCERCYSSDLSRCVFAQGT